MSSGKSHWRWVDVSGGMSQRDRPMHSWKGENPVDAFTVFIMLKWFKGKALTHPFWFQLTWYQRACSMVLLEHSLVPLVSGWYEDDIFNFTLVSVCSAFQNLDMKILSWSLIIFSGRPFLQYHRLKNWEAKCLAVILVCVAAIWMSDPSLSVIVTMASKSSLRGRGPMKSIVMELLHWLGIRRGWSGPVGFVIVSLLCWHLT